MTLCMRACLLALLCCAGSIMYQLLRMFKVAVRRCCRCCFDARRDLPSLTPAATADPKAEVQFADFLLNKRHRLSVNRRVDFEGKHGPGVEALRAVGEGVGHGEDGFLPVDEGSGGYDDGDGGGDGGDGFMTDAPTDSEFVTDDGAVMNGMVRASPQSDASEHRRRQVEHMESVIDLSDLAEEAAVATAAAQHAENRWVARCLCWWWVVIASEPSHFVCVLGCCCLCSCVCVGSRVLSP